jgi:hypothetical protein
MSIQQVPVDKQIGEWMARDSAHPERTVHYSWLARFQLALDTDNCTVTVTLRIHLRGAAASATQRRAWLDAISAKWNGKFKLCCNDDCPNGYSIEFNVVFVDTDEGAHYTIYVHESTELRDADASNWSLDGADDPNLNRSDVTHEFGHMIWKL